MAWFLLFLAGLCEIVWAALLPATRGFTNPGPSVLCAAFLAISLVLLAQAAKVLPLGTAYAIWVGIGAAGISIYGMVRLGEDTQPLRLLCIGLILAGVAGLKFLAAKG